jgi:peptide/nickel transport system permease protein
VPPPDTEFSGEITTEDPLVAIDVEAVGAGGSALPLVPEPRRPGRRKRREIAYWASVVWLVGVALAAIFANFLPLDDPNRSDFAAIAQPPSWEHWMGTDEVGRDILSRVVYGARVSLLVGVVSVLLGMFVGGLLGLSAGYIKGRVEAVIMTATDALLAFPALVLLLTLAAVFGQNLPNLVLGLAILTVPTFIRLTRANTLGVANREFVVAARAYGSKSLRVMLRDVVPNVIMPLAAYAFIIAGVVIVAEGSLSFLGLGLPPPTSSWGGMVAGGRQDLATSPHIVLMPGAVLFVTVLAFTMIGEHFRKRFDVREGVL